ncbi:hypothetical protein BU17DRAFT_72433 [Hysterangium stoloniferum]|nr:hypothetical protein BU17DRAFT_72433 [Hysterangium stoloniferum]
MSNLETVGVLMDSLGVAAGGTASSEAATTQVAGIILRVTIDFYTGIQFERSKAASLFRCFPYLAGKQTHFDCPLTSFLVVFNWDYTGWFKQPNVITQSFAAIRFIVRCTAGFECIIGEEDNTTTTGLYGILDAIKPRLFAGNPSAMGNLPQEVSVYLSKHSSVDALMEMIRELMDTLKREITELGTFAGSPSSLPDVFHDDTANISPGYSFITQEKNKFTITPDMLMDPILKCDNSQVRRTFRQAVDGQCQKILEDLFIVVHFTHAQPSPGEELLSTTIVNMPNSPRTILAFDRMIMTAIQADKTAGISGRGKVKPHWMPLELGPMFVWYPPKAPFPRVPVTISDLDSSDNILSLPFTLHVEIIGSAVIDPNLLHI